MGAEPPRSEPIGPSDGHLVRAAKEGDQGAFAELYSRYFGALYDFLARMLRDRQDAADVTQDAFVQALERLYQLRDPERFKSWIFTIAHRLAIAHIRRRERGGTTASAGGTIATKYLEAVDIDPMSDPQEAAPLKETAQFVWAIAAGLDSRSYAVLDLHVRRGLGSAEIAKVLGVTKGNAYTMVSRVKRRMADSVTTYLLARKGSKECPELAELVADLQVPPVTKEVRRTVSRHADRCQVCDATRRSLLEPSAVFADLASVPPPPGIEAAILAAVLGAGAAAGAPPSGGSAPPAGLGISSTLWRYVAGIGVALVAVLGLLWALGGGSSSTDATVLGVSVDQPAPASGEASGAGGAAGNGEAAGGGEGDSAAGGAPASNSGDDNPAATTTTAGSDDSGATTSSTTTTTAPAQQGGTTTTTAATTTTVAGATTTTTTPGATTSTTSTTVAVATTTTTTTTTTATTTTVPPTTTTTLAGSPSDPGDVVSVSHSVGVGSFDPAIVMSWTPVSGAQGYSVSWSQGPTDLPDRSVDIGGGASGTTSPALASGTWYFHLRTQGPDGTWTSTVHIGPFLILGSGSGGQQPPRVLSAVVNPGQVSEQGPVDATCSGAATVTRVSALLFDGDDAITGATVHWTIDAARQGSAPMSIVGSQATADLSFDSNTVSALESPVAVSVRVTARDEAGNVGDSAGTVGPVQFTLRDCPPAADPGNFASVSHEIGVGSTDATVLMAWTAVPGAKGYSVSWTRGAADLPDQIVDLGGAATSTVSPPLPPGSWFFHLRTQGPGGEWTATVHAGPFVIVDPPAPPDIGAVVVNPGSIFELSCGGGVATSAAVTAIVTDPDDGIVSVTLSWFIDQIRAGNVPMKPSGGSWTSQLAFPASMVSPKETSVTVILVVKAVDEAGNVADSVSDPGPVPLTLHDCPGG